jgi:N-acetylglucosamine-6-phosphate deacetylase
MEKCRELGIHVDIGHTAADTSTIRRAVGAGARLSTHLGNGCHGVLPRHPNYIWDQLAEEGLWTSMIGDGFHLPDAVLKVFHKVKQQHAILVSDAMAYAGMPPGEYTSPAIGKVVLTPEGKLHMHGNPKTLAGSASSLLQVVRHMSTITGFPEAWAMASDHPAQWMEPGGISGLQAGARADLVLLEQDRIPSVIREVWLAGQRQSRHVG